MNGKSEQEQLAAIGSKKFESTEQCSNIGEKNTYVVITICCCKTLTLFDREEIPTLC